MLLVIQLTKAVIERCLEAELEPHLGYGKYEAKAEGTTNSRNGKSRKTLKGEQGHLKLEIPRDREGSFEPQLVKKHQTRLEGFNDKILSCMPMG